MSKKALITGASRGIGAAIAKTLAASGYDLILICKNNIDKLDELKSLLENEYHITVTNFRGDVSDSSFIDSVFNSIDTINVVVNNAGISHIGLLQDMTNEEWDHIVGVNLSSVFYICRSAIKLMIGRHNGRIINISSMWGSMGASMEVAYSATKGGLNTFTKALAKELAPSNIQVNAIACGVIDTDMNRCFSTEEMDELISEIPSGRLGTCEEVAEVVKWLTTSPEYLTGQIIGIDGGFA